MKKIYLLTIAVLCASLISVKSIAGEGMWLPNLIGKNYAEMKKLGFKLTADDIYNVNKASLKDAIVSFQFCTGEFVSNQGLILTNHHCAFSSIQQHTTLDADYLTNGFWASTLKEELPADGVTASVLVRMEDVSAQIDERLKGLTGDDIAKATQKVIEEIQEKAVAGTNHVAKVKDVYNNNQYLLFIYEEYTDVRLVGAPPSSVGKFGGDADNWEWPRQTGDFAMFRVYTAPDGSPATFAAENVPFTPKRHLKISLKGVKNGDFSMVMGYPGSTNRYAFSRELEHAVKIQNPAIVKLLQQKLEIMRADMDADPSVNIKLADSYASLANGWKYYLGQNQGLKKQDVISERAAMEEEFIAFAKNGDVDESTVTMFDEIDNLYDNYESESLNGLYFSLAGLASDITKYSLQYRQLYTALEAGADEQAASRMTAGLKEGLSAHFKDYSAETDKKILGSLLVTYYKELPAANRPAYLETILSKYKGETNEDKFMAFAEDVFENSIYASEERASEFLNDPKFKTLKKDPLTGFMNSLMNDYRPKIAPVAGAFSAKKAEFSQMYLAGLMQWKSTDKMYPNANSTLRVSYGNVKTYDPRDAVSYDFYTTTDGILEKEDPNDREFIVPSRLKELLIKKDFGQYANDKGELVVAFISDNDITGGNSGSPVLNGNGELIGIAFDGNWEAMTGDLAFNDEVQRTISVDIRYVMFVIDKYAEAKNLIEEMEFVK
ncbi:MAG: hypothetical protein ACJAZ3_001552 [Sphingobacteriales bacterium]|jgi:hypothetical protein